MSTARIDTEAEIAKRYYVTVEQMDKVTSLIDLPTGKTWYQVESQTTPGDSYEVRYDTEHKRLTCTCKAGKGGFGCWHRRAALATGYEDRQQRNIKARMSAGDVSVVDEIRGVWEANKAARRVAQGNWWVSRQAEEKVRREIADGVEYPDFWKDR